MASQLHINDEWKSILAEAGLDTFAALMQRSDGSLLSIHDRGQVYRFDLPNGRRVYVKRDVFSSGKDVLFDLCRLTRTDPLCIVEAAALTKMASLDIAAPQPLAWGQLRRFCLPHQAVLMMTELPGTQLHKLIEQDPPADERISAMSACGRTARKLYQANLSWPDILPKHFMLHDGQAGVLDLARMKPTRRPLKSFMPKQIGRFCKRLAKNGGTQADEAAFMEALNCPEIMNTR